MLRVIWNLNICIYNTKGGKMSILTKPYTIAVYEDVWEGSGF
jgi:hypothetical protein